MKTLVTPGGCARRNDCHSMMCDEDRNSLAASYISRIENKQVLADVISLGKLRSLAKGLDEPIDALFRIALQLPAHDGELVSKIRENAAKLSLHRQQDLLSIAQMYFGEQRNLQRFLRRSKGGHKVVGR